MSGSKIVLALLLLLPMQSRAAEDNPVSIFATCAGRFSAELEHAWLMQDRNISGIEHLRRQFIDLLNAAVPLDQRRPALHHRIQAKAAHAQLLSQASFSGDMVRSERAARRAKPEIARCTGVLLESRKAQSLALSLPKKLANVQNSAQFLAD